MACPLSDPVVCPLLTVLCPPLEAASSLALRAPASVTVLPLLRLPSASDLRLLGSSFLNDLGVVDLMSP